jgi:micrococcal nuclease
MIKLFSKIFITVFVLCLLGYFAYEYIIPKLSEHEQKQISKEKETLLVKRVIDGDTFELENKDRVRLLGIDTPEEFESSKLDRDAERTGQDKKTIQKLGMLASDFSKKLISGKRVMLMREPDYQDKDIYGRLLRYVYLEDGTFVNKRIVEEGYAVAYRKYPISKLDEFIRAEKEARINKKGLWGSIDGIKQFDSPETNSKYNSKKQK